MRGSLEKLILGVGVVPWDLRVVVWSPLESSPLLGENDKDPITALLLPSLLMTPDPELVSVFLNSS